MKANEEILKFLDFTIAKEKQKALDCKQLKGKVAIQHQIIQLEQARKTLRLRFHDFQDYINNAVFGD